MIHFLRNQKLTNITINENTIKEISELFSIRTINYNASVPNDDNTGKKAFLTYIISFDGKGYRVFSLEELLLYFRQAKKIERIIFTLETGESLKSNRNLGTMLELVLIQQNDCMLIAASDSKEWVDTSFLTTQDILNNCKNYNGWARTDWIQLLVQILGIASGFLLSLWAALKYSPKLSIENSFIIFFLFALLIFSNTWSYINKLMLMLLNKYFPNLKFYRPDKDRIHWCMQAIIGGIALAITLSILHIIILYIANNLNSILIPNK